MGTGEFNAGGSPAMDQHPIQGGVEIFLVASCYKNRYKLRPNGRMGRMQIDFTLLFGQTIICYIPARFAVLTNRIWERAWALNWSVMGTHILLLVCLVHSHLFTS